MLAGPQAKIQSSDFSAPSRFFCRFLKILAVKQLSLIKGGRLAAISLAVSPSDPATVDWTTLSKYRPLDDLDNPNTRTNSWINFSCHPHFAALRHDTGRCSPFSRRYPASALCPFYILSFETRILVAIAFPAVALTFYLHHIT